MSKTVKKDVVIIGAGVGGLLCGALLGREGYEVLIVERRTAPGGRYTSLERDGYTVSTGSWSLGLHGTRGPLYQLFSRLGGQVEMRAPEPYRAFIRLGSRNLALPEKGGLRTVIEAMARSQTEVERVMNATRRALRWQEPSNHLTCEEWLNQYTDNKLIHGQFDSLSRMMTATYHSNYPAGEYFKLLKTFVVAGGLQNFPRRGMKAVVDEFLRILDDCKVDVLVNTPATRIVSDDGAVTGVIANPAEQESLEIDSTFVISDVGPKETVRLVGESYFDAGYLEEVSAVNETQAAVVVFGYDRPIIGHQVPIHLIEPDRLSAAWEATQIWPEWAPAGKHCLYTYSTMITDDAKRELEIIVDQCKSAFPGLAKAEIVATMTYKGIWPILRAKPERCLSIRTPIEGLYLAGDAVNPSGWTCAEGIALSSQAIAEDIEKRAPRSS